MTNAPRRAIRSTLLGALASIAIAAPLAAPAQIMTPSVPVPGEEPRDRWAHLSFAHVFQTDINDLRDAQMQRESALLILGRRFGEPDSKFKLATQFSYQLSAYNFFNDDLSQLGDLGVLNANPPRSNLQCGIATQDPAVNPNAPCGGTFWSDVHQFTFLALGTYEVDADWTVLGGGLLRLSGESGADFTDAVNGGLFTGFLYQWTDDLNVGALFGLVSEIEEDVGFVPLPLVRWKIADAWRFALGPNQLGAVGYGPKLVFVPDKTWDLSLVWSYERRRYRLDNGTGSTKNFVGDETSLPLVLQASWHPDPALDVGAFAGVVTGGNLRLETQNGHRVFDKSYQIAPTIGLNGTYRF